jgi:ribosomal protein L11
MEAKYIINIIIRSKSAESGPPLGTVLGNLGVNTVKFVKEFNDFTNDYLNILSLM